MKIFISGPISGHDDYLEKFAEAERKLKDEGFTVINPAEVCKALPKDTTHEQYMDLTMEMLSWCNAIYMLNGWEKSPGASAEHSYAQCLGKTIYFNDVKMSGVTK